MTGGGTEVSTLTNSGTTPDILLKGLGESGN